MRALSDIAWSDLDATLKARDFRFVETRAGVTRYRGSVRSGKILVKIEIGILDSLFTKAPKVEIQDAAIRKRISAHLNTDGSLCYAESAVEEYDLYDAGGAVLRVLESVKATLDQVLHSSTTLEVQREFIAYWKSEDVLYADLPAGFAGRAKIGDWARPQGKGIVLTTRDRSKLWSEDRPAELEDAFVIRADRPFDIADGGPGTTLASFRAWAAGFVDDRDVLDAAFAPSLVDGGHVVIAAENGVISATFPWPELARQAFAKAPSSRRAAFIRRQQKRMILHRTRVESVALPDLVNARLAAPSPLIGKDIVVVGAGAIGSRAILELVRSGAGQGARPLLIIDPDIYTPANFGRHVLPITGVRQPKAQEMAAEVRRLHPDLRVEGLVCDLFAALPRLHRYDLVVDATGANPVALRLNEAAVTTRRGGRPFPPIIHAAIHGNGLAAQTILVTDSAHACLKCMRPGHGGFRANPLRPGEIATITPAACGDGAHINYAAAAPMLAATLVVQAALEWAQDPQAPGPRVRTRALDLERTMPPRDKSWGVDTACPACQRAD